MKIQKNAEKILRQAISLRASDIFFVPQRRGWLLKLRTFNACLQRAKLTPEEAEQIISYLKFRAQMDISEHRRPQVGSFTMKQDGQEYFLRFSSVGNFNDQESLVVRIIYGLSAARYFLPQQMDQLVGLAKRRGLIVTSGPTGSGKTSTMYELAKRLGSNNIVMTIEDPVEIHQESFLQTQVNLTAGVSYQDLLKAALRQRPDILVIGEVRDSETAKLAVAAALSGHLVMATVHAKSTLQTLSRLNGLGVSNVELLNSLTAVSYQRLLPDCSGKLSCLLDFAYGQKLEAAIVSERRQEFVSWQQNLDLLQKRGDICHETHDQFFAG